MRTCWTPPSMARLAASSFRRSEEHTSELQSRLHLVCRLLLEKKKKNIQICTIPIPPELPIRTNLNHIPEKLPLTRSLTGHAYAVRTPRTTITTRHPIESELR